MTKEAAKATTPVRGLNDAPNECSECSSYSVSFMVAKDDAGHCWYSADVSCKMLPAQSCLLLARKIVRNASTMYDNNKDQVTEDISSSPMPPNCPKRGF